MPNHGDYEPSKGWYSAALRGWVNSPDKIGTTVSAPKLHDSQREEMARWKRGFKARPELDKLLALRDSDRADDRAKFEKITRGSTRVTLADYEAAKARAEGGGQ